MSGMDIFIALLQNRPLIALHLVAALAALAVGSVVMARRKGTIDHRRLGWTWVALMTLTAASSVFIRDFKLPNIGGYTAIHAFTISVAVLMPAGIVWIRRGNVGAHRKTMASLFIGACGIAGLFTLLPHRFLGQLVWKHWLGVIA